MAGLLGTANAHTVGMSQQPGYAGPVEADPQRGLTGTTAPNSWAQFFGPSKTPLETAPYGSYRRENFALPDAYRGANPYLTNVIITLVTEQELWPVRIALPWRLTESEMEISWDQIIFDNTLLGQVGSLTRLLTAPPPPPPQPESPALSRARRRRPGR
jgi:hypothetical protein